MEDGRYLIFYTFEDAPAPSPPEEQRDGNAAQEKPEAKPEATEERSV